MKMFTMVCVVAMAATGCGGLGLEPEAVVPTLDVVSSHDVATPPDSMSADAMTGMDSTDNDGSTDDAVSTTTDCPTQDDATTMADTTAPPADMGQQDVAAMCQSDAECDDSDESTPNFCWPGSLGANEFGCTSTPPAGKMYQVCVSTPTDTVVQLMYSWIPGTKLGNISSGDASSSASYCISIPMNQLCQGDDFGLKLAVATPVTGGPWVWWCGAAQNTPSKTTATVTIDGTVVIGEMVKEDQACDGSQGVGEGNWWAKKPTFCE